MGRAPVPEAGARHPARKILKERATKEIADALGLSPASITGARRCLKQTMADRIVEAFSGAPAPEHLKAEQTPKYAPANHPAWEILEKYSPEKIAVECGVSVRNITGTADNGMTLKLADKIAAAFPVKDEKRMKDALRAAAHRGDADGALPYLKEPAETPEEEPPSAGPCRTWVDPSVKRSPDLLTQLLQLEGAVLIIPVAELAKLRGEKP